MSLGQAFSLAVYALFLSRVSLLAVPVLVLGLIIVDPFVGRIMALVILSLLITFEIPARFRIVAAIILPQQAIIYALAGTDFARYAMLAWAFIVTALWPRRREE